MKCQHCQRSANMASDTVEQHVWDPDLFPGSGSCLWNGNIANALPAWRQTLWNSLLGIRISFAETDLAAPWNGNIANALPTWRKTLWNSMLGIQLSFSNPDLAAPWNVKSTSAMQTWRLTLWNSFLGVRISFPESGSCRLSKCQHCERSACHTATASIHISYSCWAMDPDPVLRNCLKEHSLVLSYMDPDPDVTRLSHLTKVACRNIRRFLYLDFTLGNSVDCLTIK
jgi:hypothetical protein